jgi:hypothetical protein
MPLHRHHPPPRPSQSPSLPPYPLTNIIEMDLPLFSSLSIYVAYNKLRLRDLLILKNSKKKKNTGKTMEENSNTLIFIHQRILQYPLSLKLKKPNKTK